MHGLNAVYFYILLFKCNRYSNWKQYLKCAASYLKHKKIQNNIFPFFAFVENENRFYANDSIYKFNDIDSRSYRKKGENSGAFFSHDTQLFLI